MNINIKKILNENNQVFVYGNIYNGKYTYIKDKLKDEYDLIELCYIDFYYNNYESKLERLKTKNSLSFFYNTKEKIILIREVEIISSKIISNIMKIYKNKIILIGSGDCIKNNYDIYKIKIENKENYEKIKKNKYLKEKNIKIIENDNNIDLELYKNINYIFNKKMNNIDIINVYNDEKILFPLLIHENYKNIIKKKSNNKKDIIDLILKISNIYTKFIKYENNMLVNHKWYLNDIIALYLCKYINKNVLEKYEEIEEIYKLNYTRILTKNSIKSFNLKNYIEIFQKIKIIHNFDYLLIKYINKSLIVNLKYNKKLFKKEMDILGYHKKDLLKIIKNSNEYYFINNIKELKKMI